MTEKDNAAEVEVNPLKEKISFLEKKLATVNSAFINIIGKNLDAIVIINTQKIVVYVNYAAIKFFERNIVEILGEPISVPLNLENITTHGELQFEYSFQKCDQEIVTNVNVLCTEWNNAPAYVVTFRNITEQKQHEKILDYMSTHDWLTNLPNRAFFERALESAILAAAKTREHIALMFIDVDGFKQINDTMGHEAGDIVLKEFAKILLECVRPMDTVARLGGDEFVILLNMLRKTEYAESLARRISLALKTPIIVLNKPLVINVSIGISVYPSSGTTAAELFKNADCAMYEDKNKNKNKVMSQKRPSFDRLPPKQ
ncbi:MAG: sensor domain-containing diguanylate cyclase [Gammaproteobacteria bacterium]|nr:sensor domain-containing diguanylate cyclase [Gammaproteobacteria bacterium]